MLPEQCTDTSDEIVREGWAASRLLMSGAPPGRCSKLLDAQTSAAKPDIHGYEAEAEERRGEERRALRERPYGSSGRVLSYSSQC